MKRLLLLAFDFPPIANVAVERAVRLVQGLYGCGWIVDVVTIRAKAFFRIDASSASSFPEETRIYRTPYLRLFLPMSAIAAVLPEAWQLPFKNFFAVPDLCIGWLPLLFGRLNRLLGTRSGKTRYEAVCSTSPPVSTHLAARWVKQKFGIPWVADFRDPWTDNPVLQPPTRWHRRFQTHLESKVIREADAIVANTRTNRKRLIERYPECAAKFHVIPNGYREQEFERIVLAPGDRAHFTMCHAGTLSPSYDPMPLFQALAMIRARDGEAARRIRVKLFGSHSEKEAIRRLGLSPIVEDRPWVPRPILLEELSQSDVLILCMSGERARDFWVPAKTYTYLRLAKPILALVPPGEAKTIVEEAGLGRVAPPNDAEGIAERILELYAEWRTGAIRLSPRWEVIQQYEACRLSQAMESILTAVVK